MKARIAKKIFNNSAKYTTDQHYKAARVLVKPGLRQFLLKKYEYPHNAKC